VQTTAAAARSMTTGGDQIRQLKKENPHIDVVRYEFKNQKVTVHQVDYFSEGIAIGFAENGLIPGDVVLSWLPQHFAESVRTIPTIASRKRYLPSRQLIDYSLTLYYSPQMLLQFACSKAGFVLYWLDPTTAINDPALAKKQLAAALTVSKCNVLVSQEAGSDVNYVRLAAHVIPEVEIFDFALGMPFITPRFPDLRFCIHTGFDQEEKYGWLPLRHMIVPSNNLESHIDMSAVTGSTPLAGQFEFDKDGVPIKTGKPLTNDEVIEKKIWPTYSKILEKEYHEVEGIGAVW